MKEYSLLSSQIEYYQGSVLGSGGIYTQTLVVTFPVEKSEVELQRIAREFELTNDVFGLRFTRDGKQYFIERDEYEKKLENKVYKHIHFDSEAEIYEYAKLDVDEKAVDIFGTPFNFTILTAPGVTGFLLPGHHVICDGFSVPLMFEQLAYLMGVRDTLPVGSYEQHVVEELEYPESPRFEKDKSYWVKAFEDEPETELFLGEIEHREDFSSAARKIHFSKDEADRMRSFCEEQDVSLATYVNAVSALYLHRTTGAQDFSIGSPILNRLKEEDFTTVGMYLHVVPLIVHVEDMGFNELLEDIEDRTFDLMRHQKFTQYDIKKSLGMGDVNLFDTVVDYQFFYDSLDLNYDFSYSNELSVALELHFTERRDKSIDIVTRYRLGLFDEEDIDRLEEAIRRIVNATVENPEVKVSEIEFYDKTCVLEGERVEIPNETLYSIFEKVAENNPDSPAIEFENTSYTYAEFRNLAECFDFNIRLNQRDKKPVAVIADRSVEMYAAIYGIIRGGNSYLPVSPEWPLKRILDVISDAKCETIILQGRYYESLASELAQELDSNNANRTLFLNATLILEQAKESSGGLDIKDEIGLPLAAPEDIAYVIYTSGTTGKPKGAMITDKSAVNRVMWMNEQYGLEGQSGISRETASKADAILQKTPYTFDVSVWEIFWWAFTGARLVPMKPEEHFVPEKIVDYIGRFGITHLHFVPSIFKLFTKYLESHQDRIGELKTIKHIFLSGEALEPELTDKFLDLVPDAKLHNLYGPTECAVDVTYYDVQGGEDLIPIGKPIYNTSIVIADSYGNILPRGMKGEVVILGENVGLGYINNPELTDKSFGYDEKLGLRSYRTGDLGYINEADELIYLGRNDSQVKLRGQRLELTEIQNTANSKEFITDSAVLVEELNERECIVLYYCAEKEYNEELYEAFKLSLPLYMMPEYMIRVDSIPLSQSGKLDRRKLHEIFTETDKVSTINIYSENEEEITDPLEAEIAEAFKRVLGINDIYRDTDFLRYKHSSLDIVSLLSESSVFDELTGTDIMVNSTPRSIAKLIRDKESGSLETHALIRLYDGSGKAASDGSKPEKQASLVLFPYAAGGAEAFSELVYVLKDRNPEQSIYFAGYDILHEGKVEEAAQEILELSKRGKVYFYSHCAGMAIALYIINELKKITEGREAEIVEEYVAAASTPMITKDGISTWRKLPSFIPMYLLKKSGAPESIVKDKLLEKFKDDADYFFAFCKESTVEQNGLHSVPMRIVLWEKDVFTSKPNKAEKLWSSLAADIRSVEAIDTDTHYFQAKNAEAVADIIMRERDK